jgi:hypothetical protein
LRLLGPKYLREKARGKAHKYGWLSNGNVSIPDVK